MENFEILESLDAWILSYSKIYLVSLNGSDQLNFSRENRIPSIILSNKPQKFKCPNFERLLEESPKSTITNFYFSKEPDIKVEKKKFLILFLYFINLIKTLQIDISFLFEDSCEFWTIKKSYLKRFFEILGQDIAQNKVLFDRMRVLVEKLFSMNFKYKAQIIEKFLKKNNLSKKTLNKNKSKKLTLNENISKKQENDDKVHSEIESIQNVVIEIGNLDINAEIMNNEVQTSIPTISLDEWLISFSNHYSVSLEPPKILEFLESQPLINSLFPSQKKTQPNCPKFLSIFSKNPIETLKLIIDSSLFSLIKITLNPASKQLLEYFGYLLDLQNINLNLSEAFQFDKFLWRDIHENFFKNFIDNLKLDVRKTDIKAYIAELWVNGKQDRALIIAKPFKLLSFLDKIFGIKSSLTPDFTKYLEQEIKFKTESRKNKKGNKAGANDKKRFEIKDNKTQIEELKVQVEQNTAEIEEQSIQPEENKTQINEHNCIQSEENKTQINEHNCIQNEENKTQLNENKIQVEEKKLQIENKAPAKNPTLKESKKKKKIENEKVDIEANINGALNYSIHQDDICIYQLIEIFHKDLDILALITVKLSSGKIHPSSKHFWKYSISSFLALRFPEMPLHNNLKSRLSSITPRSCQGLSREFSPLDPTKELTIQIPESEVYFVDSLEKLSSISLSGNFIGLDSEWRSNIFKHCDNPVSILQVASHDQVYIIDLLVLGNEPALNEFLLQIFEGDSVKLGVSFKEDLKKIHSHYKGLDACSRKMNKYIDVVDAYRRVFKASPGGLAGVCDKVLGKSLSKYEQRSNWENRPLRRSQMHYAALDAHVQIEAFQVILSKAENEFEKFYEPLKGSFPAGEKKKKVKRCKICFREDHLTENCHF